MSDSEEKDILTAEVMDRAERKALKEKLRKEAKQQAGGKPYEEIDAVLLKGKLSAELKAKKKLRIRLGMAGVAAIVLFWIVSTMFSQPQADVTFGICKIFLENTVRFPEELRLTTVEGLRPRGSGGDSLGGVRIWYTQIDSFGQYRMENIECYYKPDETTGAAVDKILINRREIDSQRVADFNKILPSILAGPMDLDYPPPLATGLEDLQIQTDAYRKKIF